MNSGHGVWPLRHSRQQRLEQFGDLAAFGPSILVDDEYIPDLANPRMRIIVFVGGRGASATPASSRQHWSCGSSPSPPARPLRKVCTVDLPPGLQGRVHCDRAPVASTVACSLWSKRSAN